MLKLEYARQNTHAGQAGRQSGRNERHFDEISAALDANAARQRAQLMMPVIIAALLFTCIRIGVTCMLGLH